jgi:1,4-dihydroxy-6-naphthoate synthase
MISIVPPEPENLLRIGHSPDPDDAFMWWPLAPGDGQPPRIDTGRFRFQPVLADIETLNHQAETGELEITAMSCAQYPHVQDRYAITSCGCSMGERFGPKLVAKPGVRIQDLAAPDKGLVIAVPGERTSAFAAMSLMLGKGRFRHAVAPFERIIELVATGSFPAGLVIHEGQLTFQDQGLELLADMGAWWWERSQMPMPLGINAVRRDLDEQFGSGAMREITEILLASVNHALAHREEALRYALGYARGLKFQLADQFVAMYVNRWSIDFGVVGEAAVRRFLGELAGAGLVPAVDSLEFVRPAGNVADPSTCGNVRPHANANLSK